MAAERLRIFGAALAGGAGSRMGGADKARLEVGGVALLDRALQALDPAARLAVAGGARIAPEDEPGLTVLPDPRPDRGPLAGLAASLAWAEALGADLLLTAPVDAPFLTPDLYRELIEAVAGDDAYDAAIAEGDGRTQWLAACWRPRLAGVAARRLRSGALAVAGLLDGRSWRAVQVDGPPHLFLNVNAPADLAAANAIADQEG